MYLILIEKEGDLTQSYDKTPYTNRKLSNIIYNTVIYMLFISYT